MAWSTVAMITMICRFVCFQLLHRSTGISSSVVVWMYARSAWFHTRLRFLPRLRWFQEIIRFARMWTICFVQIAAFSFGPRATHPIVLGGQFCAAVFFFLMRSLRTLGPGYILWCGTAFFHRCACVDAFCLSAREPLTYRTSQYFGCNRRIAKTKRALVFVCSLFSMFDTVTDR